MEVGNIRIIRPTESIIQCAGFALKMDDFMLCATVDLNPKKNYSCPLYLVNYCYHIIKTKNQEYLLRLIHKIEEDEIVISCDTIRGSYATLKRDEIEAVFWVMQIFN